MKAKKKGAGITILAAAAALAFFFPVLIAVVNSFKTQGEILNSALALPVSPTWENYAAVIKTADFPRAFLNSCLVTAGGIALNLSVSALAGYALSRWKSKWADVITLVFLSSMFVPFHTIMIALLTTARDLKLTGSIGGLILIYCGLQCPIPIFLIKGFVRSIPRELEEAAMIDGCGTVRMFFSVVLPMLKPTLVSVGILETMWLWNDYLLPYLVLDRKKYTTIPILIQYFRGSYGKVEMAPMMACIMITVLPVIVLYLICQKYIIDGVVAGAVKG